MQSLLLFLIVLLPLGLQAGEDYNLARLPASGSAASTDAESKPSPVPEADKTPLKETSLNREIRQLEANTRQQQKATLHQVDISSQRQATKAQDQVRCQIMNSPPPTMTHRPQLGAPGSPTIGGPVVRTPVRAPIGAGAGTRCQALGRP